MKTVRLTMAQALVRFLENQYLEVDGAQHRFVRGVFIIPGHGNVVGLGQALSQEAKHLEIYQGKNEQGMAQAAVAFAKQMKRKQICVATSSVGPGAANMVTACGTATANNIPLLVLPGASARNVARNLRQYHGFSVLFAFLAGVVGLTVSYYSGCSAGAAISLGLAAIFAVTFCLRKVRA